MEPANLLQPRNSPVTHTKGDQFLERVDRNHGLASPRQVPVDDVRQSNVGTTSESKVVEEQPEARPDPGSVVGKGNAEDDAADGGSEGSGQESRKTLFRFSDAVVSASRTLGNLIRDETTSKSTKRDSEDGGNGRGPGFAEGKQVGGLREEDGFLDITGDDPGEEVSVDDASPEDGGDGDKGEWTEEDLDDVLDGLAGAVEFDDAPKRHTALGMGVHVAAGCVDRVAGGVETIRCIHEMVTVVVGLGEEEDGSDEVDAGTDGAEPPEPLQGKLLSNPSVDDAAHR